MSKGSKNLSLATMVFALVGSSGPAPAQEGNAAPAAKAEAVGRDLAERHKECLGFFSAKDEQNFGKCLAADVRTEFVDTGQPAANGPPAVA